MVVERRKPWPIGVLQNVGFDGVPLADEEGKGLPRAQVAGAGEHEPANVRCLDRSSFHGAGTDLLVAGDDDQSEPTDDPEPDGVRGTERDVGQARVAGVNDVSSRPREAAPQGEVVLVDEESSGSLVGDQAAVAASCVS